jgi:hypothetical protein
MNLIIFSCSPRPENMSNTAAMVNAFKEGVESAGESDVEIFYINKRQQWDKYRTIFANNQNIIFAMPLFAECIPEIFIEFIEFIEPKPLGDSTKIGFILQGGFKEEQQLKAVEDYFEEIPGYLNCNYSGTLVKGGTFTIKTQTPARKCKMMKPFFEMGFRYVKEGVFDKAAVSYFNAHEKNSKLMVFFSYPCLYMEKVTWRVIERMKHTNL